MASLSLPLTRTHHIVLECECAIDTIVVLKYFLVTHMFLLYLQWHHVMRKSKCVVDTTMILDIALMACIFLSSFFSFTGFQAHICIGDVQSGGRQSKIGARNRIATKAD